jgi:hypothetical protein
MSKSDPRKPHLMQMTDAELQDAIRDPVGPNYKGYREAAQMILNIRKSQEPMTNAIEALREWVRCPVCGEPDMSKEGGLIDCVNLNCLSNGGTNDCGLPAREALATPTPRGELEGKAKPNLAELLKGATRQQEYDWGTPTTPELEGGDIVERLTKLEERLRSHAPTSSHWARRAADEVREAAALLDQKAKREKELVDGLLWIADFADVTTPASWMVDVQAVVRRARRLAVPK